MSTKKITTLTELSAAPAATDMLPIVDVSDTTDAGTGTTKKITALNVGKGIGIGAGNTTSEPVKIDTSNGRLGVGTDSPDTLVEISSDTSSLANTLRFTDTDTTSAADQQIGKIEFYSSDSDRAEVKAYIGAFEADTTPDGYLAFATQESTSSVAERMRITESGNVGIGATTPSGILHTADSSATNILERFNNGTGGPVLVLQKSRGTSVGANTVTQDGDTIGSILFKGADGDSFAAGASINAAVDGTPSDGDMPGRLMFQTTADGAESVTERMRIDSTGNVLLGGTATPTSSIGNLCLFNGTAPAASVANGIVLYAEDATGSSELKVRDEAGNIATLSPHNFDLLGGRSEDMAWSYSCKNAFAGKEIAVDMTKVIRALEKLTGEEYIKIRDIPDSEKLDWDEEEKRKEVEQKANIDAYKDRKTKSVLTEEEPTAYAKKSKPDWMK